MGGATGGAEDNAETLVRRVWSSGLEHTLGKRAYSRVADSNPVPAAILSKYPFYINGLTV